MHPPIRVWVYWSQKGITHYISFIIHAINFFTITFQVIRSLPQSSICWPTASQSPCKEYYRYIAIITLTDSDVHLVPAGTMLFLYVSQITLHAVMRRWMKQKRATSTVKHELNVSWIDICPDVVIGPAANYTWTMSNFPWIDHTIITNLMHWLLFIRKILLLSSTCFEYQVLIFRRT